MSKYSEVVTEAVRRWMPPAWEGERFRDMTLIEQHETIAFMLANLIRLLEKDAGDEEPQ